MILLKKPYTPVVYTSASKTFNVYGKSFMRLEAVYLSGLPYNNQTFFNPFSAFPKLSAGYPGFTAIKLLSSEYTTNLDNTITITMPSAARGGYVDVIAQNPAGYGALTQYVIKERYTNTQDLSTLRPWSQGINVAAFRFYENQMLTIDGDILVTIANENILTIDQQTIVPPITSETFYLVTNNNQILITNTNDKIVFGI